MGSILLDGNKVAMTVDWCKHSKDAEMTNALVVLDQDSHVIVYDTRKLSSVDVGTKENPAVLHHFQPRPKEVIEVTIFGPGKGQYLIGASQLYETDKTSNISVWDWTKSANISSESVNLRAYFPAHVEGVYAMALSPDGSRLATGGADSIVGIWDTKEMICTHTVSKNRTKYIRAVEFSNDGLILAHASEEDDIELVDSVNGEIIGQVNLHHRTGGESGGRQSNLPHGGAENLAWHPKQSLLACARVDTSAPEEASPPLVTVAKLNLSKSR
jgi:WD40 repeat protein